MRYRVHNLVPAAGTYADFVFSAEQNDHLVRHTPVPFPITLGFDGQDPAGQCLELALAADGSLTAEVETDYYLPGMRFGQTYSLRGLVLDELVALALTIDPDPNGDEQVIEPLPLY